MDIYRLLCLFFVERRGRKNQIISFLNKQKSFSAKNHFIDILEFGEVLKSNTFLVMLNFFEKKGGIDGFFIACLTKNQSYFKILFILINIFLCFTVI